METRKRQFQATLSWRRIPQSALSPPFLSLSLFLSTVPYDKVAPFPLELEHARWLCRGQEQGLDEFLALFPRQRLPRAVVLLLLEVVEAHLGRAVAVCVCVCVGRAEMKGRMMGSEPADSVAAARSVARTDGNGRTACTVTKSRPSSSL